MRVSLNMGHQVAMAIKEMAVKSHRTVSSEIIVAIERHIEGYLSVHFKQVELGDIEVGEPDDSDDDEHPL